MLLSDKVEGDGSCVGEVLDALLDDDAAPTIGEGNEDDALGDDEVEILLIPPVQSNSRMPDAAGDRIMKDDEEEKEGESPEEKVNEDDDQADDNASVDEDWESDNDEELDENEEATIDGDSVHSLRET